MFAGKAGAHLIEAPFSCSTLGLAPYEGLLRKLVTYGRKKFFNIDPRIGPRGHKLGA
jgi:hypothetical protein